MDFMLAYGSDEEDDIHPEGLPTTQPTPATTSTTINVLTSSKSSAPTEVPKKRKKLDISILPQHIQDALLRGDNEEDSDDDANKPVSRPPTSQSSRNEETKSSKHQTPSNESDPLLRMLSAPKASEKQDPFQSQTKVNQTNIVHKEAYTNNSDEGEEEHPQRLLQQPASVKSTQPMIQPKLASFPSQQQVPTVQRPTVSTASIDWSQVAAPTASSIPTATGSLYNTNSMYGEESSSSTLKRKRDREIESQLLSGNLASIESIPLRQIEGYNEWDKLSYLEQQEKEQSIMKMYTGDGSIKSMALPSKSQNRKHQLTSLALKAAETEISLLEAKGQRSKSKAQTMNRYGW